MSSSYFGGVDLRAFDFVGFFESRERDLRRLSSNLGIPLRSDICVNRTTTQEAADRQALMEDTTTLATLRPLLADDVAFYEAVRAHWDGR
jgi:hypothetical protein